jgi:carbonic anhydrase
MSQRYRENYLSASFQCNYTPKSGKSKIFGQYRAKRQSRQHKTNGLKINAFYDLLRRIHFHHPIIFTTHYQQTPSGWTFILWDK